MIKGFLPEMQELPGCFCPPGSWLVFGVQALLCREMININYELLGHWKLLVWVFLLGIYIEMRWSPSRVHGAEKMKTMFPKTFLGGEFCFLTKADPLGFHHPPAPVAFIKCN